MADETHEMSKVTNNDTDRNQVSPEQVEVTQTQTVNAPVQQQPGAGQKAQGERYADQVLTL